jgi:hypothetical protein
VELREYSQQPIAGHARSEHREGGHRVK